MRKIIGLFLAFCLLVATASATEKTLQFGPFGKITLYHTSPQPAHVALFLSGDGGWNRGVVDMARELASFDALVVGVDVTYYLRSLATASTTCAYPAGDLEQVSKFVQQHLGFAHYVTPVLVGYSSGATLAYATLVQAPHDTFAGAISLGFCPDLSLTQPPCRGSGLAWEAGSRRGRFNLKPATNLKRPWIALQGDADQVCNPNATTQYAHQVSNGEAVLLPGVGHGFSVTRNWMPQFKQSFARIANSDHEALPAASADELHDLPLIEVPAEGSGDLLAVHLTGDGGWGVTDRGLAEALASHGIPVVGLNSLQYFWKYRTPEAAAEDLNRIVQHYLMAWKKQRAIVIGYSFGADALPFLLNRLPKDTLDHISLVTFLGLGSGADFEFHVVDWLGLKGHSSLPVQPEVDKLKKKDMLCFYGAGDKDALCPQLRSDLIHSYSLKGGHRIGSNFEPIVEAILNEEAKMH
jgi:type IV secretory pathway VirJ component